VGVTCDKFPNIFIGIKSLAAFACLLCDVTMRDVQLRVTWLFANQVLETVYCDGYSTWLAVTFDQLHGFVDGFQIGSLVFL